MKKTKFYIFALISVMLFGSCGKEGAVGPKGPDGTQGAIGPAGPKGANGQDGSIIYSGTTAPNAATGKVGDFYLNQNAALLYGPKTAAGWGTGVSLKGATGAAGSKIYSGAVVPATTLGKVGDFYLNNANYLLYGPKTATGWGVPVSLRGPEGNANVKTDVFTIASADWLWNSSYGLKTSPSSNTYYFTRYYTRPNNSITQDVLDNGMVLVYFTPDLTGKPNQWAPLPYQFTASGGSFDYNVAFETAVGSVKLHYFFVKRDKTATLPELSTLNIATYKIKIVAVTGKLGSFMVNHHVDLKNYNEVSRVTGLWQKDNN